MQRLSSDVTQLGRLAHSQPSSAILEMEKSAVTWKQWGGKMSCLAPSCLVGPDGGEPVSNTWPDGNRKGCRQTGSFPANGRGLTGWRGRHTPPKGRAQGREAYDFITRPTPMTSPGGEGARLSKLFMEKGRRPGTDPDPEPFQMWLDTASSWPSGKAGGRGKAGGIQLMGAGLLEAHGSFSRDFQSSRFLPLGICSSLRVLIQNSPAIRLAEFRRRAHLPLCAPRACLCIRLLRGLPSP